MDLKTNSTNEFTPPCEATNISRPDWKTTFFGEEIGKLISKSEALVFDLINADCKIYTLQDDLEIERQRSKDLESNLFSREIKSLREISELKEEVILLKESRKSHKHRKRRSRSPSRKRRSRSPSRKRRSRSPSRKRRSRSPSRKRRSRSPSRDDKKYKKKDRSRSRELYIPHESKCYSKQIFEEVFPGYHINTECTYETSSTKAMCYHCFEDFRNKWKREIGCPKEDPYCKRNIYVGKTSNSYKIVGHKCI
jgi:hypothetical protein